MRKLLATLLLSALPLAASAQVYNSGYVFSPTSYDLQSGYPANMNSFNLMDTSLTDYTLSMGVVTASGSLEWYTVQWLPNGTGNSFRAGLKDEAIIFKLETGGDTFYAGVDGFSDNVNTVFVAGGKPSAFISFESNGTSFFAFSANHLGQGSLQSLSAVPEPETYAMLLAGLGLVGAVARRRKQ